MISKNSPLAQATIINFSAVLFLFFLQNHSAFAAQACTKEYSSKLNQDLGEYLKQPSSKNTQSLVTRLCQAALEGPSPCPFSITQDRVADFASASEKNVESIAVLACATKIVDGAVAEELNELQAANLDRYDEKFFKGWQLIPSNLRKYAQKFEDFVFSVSKSQEDLKQKVSLYEKRSRILERAPAYLKTELDESLKSMKEEVRQARQELALHNEPGEIVFSPSKFYEILRDKIMRMKTQDPKRWAITAQQTFLSEGINYKVRLKNENAEWPLCPLTTTSSTGCYPSQINLIKRNEKCGTVAYINSIAQKDHEWVVATQSSQFRFQYANYIEPSFVELKKSSYLIRKWALPYGFTAIAINKNLNDLFIKFDIKSLAGRKLGSVFAIVRSSGHMQFIEFSEKSDDVYTVSLAGKNMLKIKGPDGSFYELHKSLDCD